MAIRMNEWGMLAAPGQPVHVRTQGLYGWERVGRILGEGLASVVDGGVQLARMEKVSQAGELAAFSEQLRSISAEVSDELSEEEVQDWEYSWNAAAAPRIREALQGLSPSSREAGAELARAYSAQSSIEARRDREIQRVSTARGRWQQQVEASISAGQEEQATRWLEAGCGVFVPEEQLESRRKEVRSRACRSRWEARLQASPLEALCELASARQEKGDGMPLREEESRRLEDSCERVRQTLRRELASSFSESLRAGTEPESFTMELAARAGVIPAVMKRSSAVAAPTDEERSSWRQWLDEREDGEEGDIQARLAIAAAPLPLEERRALLSRLERTAQVPAVDRKALSNRLFFLYHSGAFGCPGDAEARRALLELQEAGANLLAEQGSDATADWLKSCGAGADNWVCFEAEKSRRSE